MKTTVNLMKKKVKTNGSTYDYWVLRWFGSDGKRYSKNLGRTDALSPRQAKKLREEKQRELDDNPGRRDVGKCPDLHEFLEQYYADRKIELRPGTLELHRLTGRYLVAFFGETRRLDSISRPEARAFKTALANGELSKFNKRVYQGRMEATTVDQHIRNAKTFFNRAHVDDLILFNPFCRIEQSKVVTKDWQYVDDEMFTKMLAAAKPGWKLLFGLARWAGLRLEEALELPVGKISLEKRRLVIISRDDSAKEGKFTVKTKDSREVPICPELAALLQQHLDPASELVIPAGSIVKKNVWRDFQVIAKRAGVKAYAKPIHTLRKSRITDWASEFPPHVVMAWAGHSDLRTTQKFYSKVQESDFERATGMGAKGASASAKQAEASQIDEAGNILPFAS